jgi:hypothetical protein
MGPTLVIAELTASVATLLWTEPLAFRTVTRTCPPLSAVCELVRVYVLLLMPTGAPLKVHS